MVIPTQDVLWLRNRALDSTQVSVAIADARSRDLPIIDVNTAFTHLTGYDQAEVIGRNCRFLQGSRSDGRVAASMRDAIEKESESRVVILNYRKDGHPFWNEVIVSPVYDNSGTLTHFVATQMDVTERVRIDQYQQLLNEIESAIAERLDLKSVMQPVAILVVREVADACAIYLKDEEGEIQLVASSTSKAVSEISDLQLAIEREFAVKAVPDEVRECIESDLRPTIWHSMENSVPSVQLAVITAPIVGNNHTFGAISFAVDEKIRIVDASCETMAEDVCHRIGSMFEIGLLYRDLQTAIDVRDEFLSIAAHELRTPISSIKGYSQLLLRGLERGTLLPERLRLGLRTIESSASRLAALTSDLLEVSRAGMNSLPLHLESISVFDYVSRFLDEHQSLRPDPHEFVLVSSDPGIRGHVDVGRLDQVMTNLASNAIKYSPADKPVEFEILVESDGIAILVRDCGLGLEDGDSDRIFQPFQRSKAAIASNAPGMGLGLFISRNIIERHNGTLTANSEGSGHGSTFRIWLPLDKSPVSEA